MNCGLTGTGGWQSWGGTGLFFCALLLMLASGCHRQRMPVASPTAIPPPAATSKAPSATPATVPMAGATMPAEEMVGLASWYGHPYHGRRTTNGEIYDMNQMTAAHRTLPFDTIVNVSNLDNGKEVKVRINDRGPFVDGRIIDLSFAAAKAIDMVGPGTARVKLDIQQAVPNPYPLTIQVGAFSQLANAEKLKATLSRDYAPLGIREGDSPKGTLYRVYVGQFTDYASAQQTLKKLKAQKYEGWIVRSDSAF